MNGFIQWGWTIVGVAVTMRVVWFWAKGYYTAEGDFWHRMRAGFDGSATKVVGWLTAAAGALSSALPEILSVLGDSNTAAFIKTVWPQQAGIAMMVIGVLVNQARNRTLKK